MNEQQIVNETQQPVDSVQYATTQPQRPTYTDIGGWLILVVIGLIVTPIRMIFTIIKSTDTLKSDALQVFESPNSPHYNPTVKSMIVGESVVNGFIGLFAILLLMLMYDRSKLFPKLMIGYLAFNFVATITGAVTLEIMIPQLGTGEEAWGGVVKSMIVAGIWIPYFLQSERVKGTFVK